MPTHTARPITGVSTKSDTTDKSSRTIGLGVPTHTARLRDEVSSPKRQTGESLGACNCKSRLHAFVFSDEDESDDEHASWMSHIPVVINRAPRFSDWKTSFSSNRQALRDRNNLRRIKYACAGNFVPRHLKGAEVATSSAIATRYEQHHDRQFLRPPGAPVYRAASCFTGAGVFDEAARRAKFNVCFSAEVDANFHAPYYNNTGVSPYNSNAEMLRDMSDDVEMMIFGSNCRSIARSGLKRGKAATEDWAEFDRVVEYLGKSDILQFVYENVSDLVTDRQCSELLEHVLTAFDEAGYCVRYDLVDPANFGCGASRPRALFLGMKRRAGALVGFMDQSMVTTGPIGKN